MAQGSGLAVKLSSRDILVPLYTLGIIGAFMQISGGYWDVSWHTLELVETFFGPNHIPLYAGVAFALLASLVGLLMRFRTEVSQRHLLTGLHVALVGGALQVIAGPADFWWHSTFGFDPFLFTPSHLLLIIGIILNGFGMAIGSVRLLQEHHAKISLGRFLASSKWLQLLVIVALTTLWLDLNTVVYLITDVDGIAYTFQLSKDFVDQTFLGAFVAGTIILGATGTLVFFTAKSILGWRGAVTAIALLSAVVSATANLGFRAFVLGASEDGPAIVSFIPLYLSFVIPVFVFDLLVKDSNRRRTMLLAAALISPFASFLDGWNALPLWTQASQLIPALIIPTLVAGLIAGLSRFRFVNALLLRQPVSVPRTR